MSIKCEFWDVPERGGIWRAEIEGGLDGRMAHLTAASFAELDAQIQAEMQRRLPQPKPVVEAPVEHFTEARPFGPVDPPVTITERDDDIQAHVELPDGYHIVGELHSDAGDLAVAKTPKRRGRPPRARDANEDGA